MDTLINLLQLIVGLGILNVWLLRFNQKTPYRGCDAASLKAEFSAYGLPEWSFYCIGFLKVVSAILLIVAIWIPYLALPASAVIALLMLGAVIMHLKVHDSWKKALPAFVVLVLSLIIFLFRWY